MSNWTTDIGMWINLKLPCARRTARRQILYWSGEDLRRVVSSEVAFSFLYRLSRPKNLVDDKVFIELHGVMKKVIPLHPSQGGRLSAQNLHPWWHPSPDEGLRLTYHPIHFWDLINRHVTNVVSSLCITPFKPKVLNIHECFTPWLISSTYFLIQPWSYFPL